MLNPGDRFGDYTVVRLLGKGGMGAVYLLENANGAQVAAKILDPASAGDHETRRRFVREAELALGVKHLNLVETYDVGEDPDTGLCYILMEYVPGGSLADRLRKGPLSINEAISIVYQIASVLELARQKGIVHRDIKPANIMFDAEGTPKLADLGIARGGLAGTETTTVTQTGMMIGTPAYMAPEQMLDAHHVDSRADIYSLGIVFYEMLAGQRPNPTDTVVQLMAKAVAGEPIPDVRTMRPEVSAAVAELVSLMCAMKADERVATPREVTTALSQIAHGREVTIRRKAPNAVRTASAANGRKAVAVWGGALAVAAVVAVGVWCFVGGRTKSQTRATSQSTVVTNTLAKADGATAALSDHRVIVKSIAQKNVAETSLVENGGQVSAGVSKSDESAGSETADLKRETQEAIGALFPGWKVSGGAPGKNGEGDSNVAFRQQWRGRPNVLSTRPASRDQPCVFSRNFLVSGRHPLLVVEVASQNADADFLLSIFVNRKRLVFGPRLVCTPDEAPYERIVLPLSEWRGKEIELSVSHCSNGVPPDFAFWGRLEVVEGSGCEMAGAQGVSGVTVFPRVDAKFMNWASRVPWAYSVRNPGSNWKSLDFDDSKWNRTKKALGCGVKDVMTVSENWTEPRIWLRRKFFWHACDPVYKAMFDMRWDQDAEIFLNGDLIMRRTGWRNKWTWCAVNAELFRKSLRQGENCLSVTLRGDPPNFFDCGLSIETRTGKPSEKVGETDERGRTDWIERPARLHQGAEILVGYCPRWPKPEAYFRGVAPSAKVRYLENGELASCDLSNVSLAFMYSCSSADYGLEAYNVRRFLQRGVNVIFVAHTPNDVREMLLYSYGMRYVPAAVGAKLEGVCPGLIGQPIQWTVSGMGRILNDCSSWQKMISGTGAEQDVAMAMRPCGSGRLIFLSSSRSEDGLAQFTGRSWWHRVLRGCGIPTKDGVAADGGRNQAEIGVESLNEPDSTRRDQKAVDALFPGWSISGNRPQTPSDGELVAGSILSYRGRENVFLTHPADDKAPAVLSRTLKLGQRHPVLLMEVASAGQDADFLLTVKVNGRSVFAPRVICTPDMRPYERLTVPLSKWRGKKVKVEVEHSANGWYYEHAFWSKLEVAEGDGKEILGPVGVVRTEVFPRANPSSSRWKKRTPWLYVTEAPAADWKDCGFDDRKWKRTVKAFGDDRPPAHMSVAQSWKSDRIWMRRKFDWNGPTDIYKVELDLYYDQDAEIFLNGREVARRDGWNTDWVPQCIDSHAFAGALRRGENVLAVTLKGNSGGSYFDCGLSIETPDGDAEVAIPGQSSIDPKKLYHDDTTKAVQKTLNVLFPGWKTSANRARNKGTSSVVGFVADYRGKKDLVCTLPPSEDEPVSISRRMRLPSGHPALRLSVCKNMTYQADFLLQVLVGGKKVHEETVNDGKWHEPVVDLSAWAGRDAKIEIRQCQLRDNAWGRAYWSKIAVE